MDNRKERIQPAVRKETEHVMVYTAAGVAVMWCVFLALHLVMPEKVPFDYTVILGGLFSGICTALSVLLLLFGGAVAVLNFFLMGMAVQKAAAETEEAAAKRWIQASYSQRNMMQMLWVILTIVLPCFQFVAGILPLLIPGTAIKLVRAVKGK